MAIYRGPGGAGDATGDATNASALALAAKDAAQASATSASASATAAASSATAADTSATNASTQATNAAGSATTASTAATNASTYATNAASSATTAASEASDAADSATAAASSATSASTDASTASTQASNASSSASSASTSASTATTKASEAATSATNAASSASTASTAATNASNSASAAATSETNAASSASSASTSASTATTKASEASTSATSASTSASTATTQASNAASSASAANTSASNASTSATNAASSASSAASSAASAAAALDSFDDRYLGSKTSNPTVDNDGNALVTGALYYNSVAGEMRVYDGSQWIAASAASQAILTKYKYVATAGQTTFTGSDANALTLSYTVGSIIVTLNGAVLDAVDYTASSGTSIVLASAASLNDEVGIFAFSTFNVANTYTQAQADAKFVELTGDTMTGDLRLNNGNADGAQLQLASSGYSDWNWDNYSGRLRAYYGSTEYFTINASGNVGIGTSSPASKLNVVDAGTGANTLLVQSGQTGTTPRSNTVLRLQTTATGRDVNIQFSDNVTNAAEVGMVGGNMYFTTAGAERARIDPSGNLLVGLTSSVAGKLQVKNNSGDASSGITVVESGTNNYWSQYMYTVTHDLYFSYNNVNKGYFQSSNGVYVSVSDERLKKDIQDLPYGLNEILSLRPTSYRMTEQEDVDAKSLGFIAQEAMEVLPETVFEMQGGMYGMDKAAIIPVLVKAIQEQQALIKQQAAALTTLTERITALENK